MVINIYGPNFFVRFNANELASPTYNLALPKGYSINTLYITNVVNIWFINGANARANSKLVFPVVNSKSPSTISLTIADITKDSEIRFTIGKFGQIPDPHYFDKAFDPILVTSDDGNTYPIIPSDQFN